ncbi:retron Ec67 family RNA-directed DNA polymerase/endonuclease [Agrobacterium tumefaciens]|uniref:retron Ec67 family RNA-directed DNA polymerase/endonuclease n=1 Tax=Agrobacterium tumefaciens TaxID=358 RepID=UPI001572C5D0|nr:RNA-directed DNA polymerase [Agrobacterium tumefaciens]
MTKKIYHFGLAELTSCVDLGDLARLLEIQPKFLSKQIYHTPYGQKYTHFPMPKKDGSTRNISAPNKNLKFIQSRLSRLLYQCYFDIHGAPEFPGRALSHGFQKGRDLSIFTNAKRHTNRRFVFNTDIENFFPSFNFGRVRGYFIKNQHFQLKPTVATVIAQTACFMNILPQGAPSSPIISELISQTLDYRLQALARKYRCSYSRYADDITFSTNLKEFPSAIAFCPPGEVNWREGPSLEKAVLSSNLKLNSKKARMQQSYQRQATTGLTVNDKVNISTYYYKGVRFCAHAMMTKGKAVANNKLSVAPNGKLSKYQLWGMLCHINDIKGRELPHKALRAFKSSPVPSYLKLMKDFYHYYRIHTAEKPLIICEGKTDYIYLKEAIRWNVSDARVVKNLISGPALINFTSDKGDHWGVDFVNHSNMAGNLLDLAGGGGDLPKFATYHVERVKKLFAEKPPMPVIIVVDNDKQSEGMWTTIKSLTGSPTPIDGSAPYYHVGENLYVVPIPSAGKKDFYIEKLIPSKWLKKTLNGKTLKLNQKKDEKLKPTEYGKMDFANKVIRANRGNVDLTSFLPLLHTICDIIELP